MQNNQPLHKTTHWRRLRSVITAMTKKCGVNIELYDIEHIKCYYTIGKNLMGSNVTLVSPNTSGNRSCFVSDNPYEIYECPLKSNKKLNKGAIGEFLVVAHNQAFDYWLLAIMKYEAKLNEDTLKTYVNVKYNCKLNVNVQYINDKNIKVFHIKDVNALQLGINKTDIYFDSLSHRANAYQWHPTEYNSKNNKNNNYKLATNEKVKIYRDKKKK